MQTGNRRRCEQGQTAVEYLGMVVIVTLMLSAIAMGTPSIRDNFEARINDLICEVADGPACHRNA